jgi:acyl-CoA synthetase (AMP-forming)/AMP-acid ligase II
VLTALFPHWVRSDVPALVTSSGHTTTYAELLDEVMALATQLREHVPLVRGAMGVACADPRSFLVASLAVLALEQVLVPLSPRRSRDDVLAQATTLRAACVVHALSPLDVTPLGDARADFAFDDLLVLSTSGSSGVARHVVLGAPGVRSNIEAVARYLPLHEAPRTGIVLPLVYGYALVGQAFTTLYAGGTLVLLGDVPTAIDQLHAAHRLDVQGLSGVALTLSQWARAAGDVDESARPRLQYLANAGGPLPLELAHDLLRVFPDATLWNQYGLTEASPRVAAVSSRDAVFWRGSVGRALPGLEVRAVDDAGEALPPGVAGLLTVRGASVMRRYLDDDEATAAALRDGTLWTGDLGHVDDTGAIYVQGRVDDVVKVAGERTSLVQLARTLTVAGAREVFVAAVPDAALGARLVAFVAGDDDVTERLRTHARRALPPAQRPQRVVQLPSLPRLPSGKIDRAALTEQARDVVRGRP